MKRIVRINLVLFFVLIQLHCPSVSLALDVSPGGETLLSLGTIEEECSNTTASDEGGRQEAGTALLPGAVESTDIHADKERVASLDGNEGGAQTFDAEGNPVHQSMDLQDPDGNQPIDDQDDRATELADVDGGDSECMAVTEGEPSTSIGGQKEGVVCPKEDSGKADAPEPQSRESVLEGHALIPQDSGHANSETLGEELALAAQYRDVIEDGVYEIGSALGGDLRLDLHSSSEQNYQNVEIRSMSEDLRQRWYVEHDKDGFVSFYNMLTGKALDVYGGNAVPRENVQQYQSNGTRAQKWVVVPSATRSGMFHILSALDIGLALDVYDGRAASGTNVWVYRDNGSAAQCFSFSPKTSVKKQEQLLEDGFYAVSTTIDQDYGLGVTGTAPSSASSVKLIADPNMNAQVFHISYTDGFYRFQNAQSGKYLDVQGNGLNLRSDVCQQEKTGSSTQEWAIYQEHGFCYIVNRASGLSLDVYDGKACDRARVWLYQRNYSKAQAWLVKPFVPLCDGRCYSITSYKNASYGIEVQGQVSSDAGNVQPNAGNVQLSKYDASFSEKWVAHCNGDGVYSFESLVSGKLLGASESNVCQVAQETGDSISWRLVPSRYGFNFVNEATGLLMDINGGKIAEGTNIKLWKSNGGAAQIFYVNEVPILEERTYTIRLAGSNELVDVRSGKKDPGVAIQLFHNNGANAQMWIAVNNYDGTTSLVSERSGLAVSRTSSGVVQEPVGGGRDLQHRWIIAPKGDGTFAIVVPDGSGEELAACSNQDRSPMVVSQRGTLQHSSFVFEEASPRGGGRAIGKARSISFSDGGSLFVDRGTQMRLAVDLSPRLAKQAEIVFRSEDTTIAEVSAQGYLNAIRPGTTRITAQFADESSKAITCELTVGDMNGQVTKEMLDEIARSDCDELMVVAHPDDETFWGGGHLIEGNYLVVCLTNGGNLIRNNEFNNAMDISGCKRLILGYPDTDYDQRRNQWEDCREGIANDLRAILSVKHWNTVATHNSDGDTGHIHHKLTNELVTRACHRASESIGSYYNFGTFYRSGDSSIDQITPNITGELLDTKLRMVDCYRAERSAYLKYWSQMMPHEHWEKMAL